MINRQTLNFLLFLNAALILAVLSWSQPGLCLEKAFIENVSVDRTSFNPTLGQQLNIRFRLIESAHIVANLYDSMNLRIRTLMIPENLPAGRHNIAWDGRDDADEIVCNDFYIYTLTANTENGRFYVFDPADETYGWELKPRKLRFDPKNGNIHYVLPKAARVRLRVGISDGMLLRTLLDWIPQEAGAKQILWDGKDSGGHPVNPDSPNITVALSAFSLPSNSIIVTGGHRYDWRNKDLKEAVYRPKRSVENDKTKSRRLNPHAFHSRKICHEPKFTIEFPEKKNTETEAIPVVTGITPMRITISEQDRIHIVNTRFEVIIFIDGIFLFEEEDATTPYTYLLNTRGITTGDHIITVNVQDYQHHIGAVCKKIRVQR